MAIAPNQVVRIVQIPAHSGEDLHASRFSESGDMSVTITGIGVCVLFKDEMRDAPFFEQFREDGCWGFAN